ncbi:MAG: tol-pal system protein YbgF [Desulfobacterales bacterium]|nr:tol-pal system protein YbgF [Desulfobacterales bacterium]
MRKKDLYRLCVGVIIFSVIPFSSCVYDKEFTYLNDQMIALNKRVKTLEENLDTKVNRDIDSKVTSIRSNQADLRVEIEQVQGEVKRLSGRVEENEHLIKRAVERDLGDQDAARREQSQLKEKVAEMDALVKRHEEYLGSGMPVAREKIRPGVGPVEQAEVKREQGTGIVEPKSGELVLYEKALASYREGNYEGAMEGFTDFLKKYPKSDRADNAQFWIGESYMALKQYEQAILAFQEVIKKYPEGNKVPNALLRQALAFLEIKDKTSCELLLKKIIKNYPGSSEAKIAEKKLATLK